MPVFEDDGDTATPFAIQVGSESPVAMPLPDPLKDRGIIIQNPSTKFQLYISTWAGFTDANHYFVVNRSSAAVGFANHQQFYAKYPSGASTSTVRGVVLKQ